MLCQRREKKTSEVMSQLMEYYMIEDNPWKKKKIIISL